VSRTDRRALRAVAVQFFANGMVYATVIPRLPDIRERVDISIGALGLVLTLGSVASLIGSLLTGRAIARLGSRRVMIYGAVCSIGFLPVIGFSTVPVVLVAALFGLLFFDVFIDVAMNVQGSALSQRRHMPVMNRLHGLWSLGSVAGGVITVLTLRIGVSTPMHLTGVALLLIGALAFVAPGLLHRDEAPELEEAAPPRSRRRPLGAASLVLGVGGAMAMAIEITNGDWASFRLGEDLGARPGIAGLAFLTFTTGMTVGRLGGDWLQVRLGPPRLFQLSAILAGTGSVLASLIPVTAVSIAGFMIAGLGTSVLFPQLYDRAARSPGPPGSGFASMLIGQRGAGLVAPLVVGWLADTDALDVGQAMAIVTVPAALVVFLGTFRPTPRPTPPDTAPDTARPLPGPKFGVSVALGARFAPNFGRVGVRAA
jgi:fucose permease